MITWSEPRVNQRKHSHGAFFFLPKGSELQWSAKGLWEIWGYECQITHQPIAPNTATPSIRFNSYPFAVKKVIPERNNWNATSWTLCCAAGWHLLFKGSVWCLWKTSCRFALPCAMQCGAWKSHARGSWTSLCSHVLCSKCSLFILLGILLEPPGWVRTVHTPPPPPPLFHSSCYIMWELTGCVSV